MSTVCPRPDNVAPRVCITSGGSTTSGNGISLREAALMRRLPTVRCQQVAQSVGNRCHLAFGPAIERADFFGPCRTIRSARRLLQIGKSLFQPKVFSPGKSLKAGGLSVNFMTVRISRCPASLPAPCSLDASAPARAPRHWHHVDSGAGAKSYSASRDRRVLR